jgi:hypothetical protein
MYLKYQSIVMLYKYLREVFVIYVGRQPGSGYNQNQSGFLLVMVTILRTKTKTDWFGFASQNTRPNLTNTILTVVRC